MLTVLESILITTIIIDKRFIDTLVYSFDGLDHLLVFYDELFTKVYHLCLRLLLFLAFFNFGITHGGVI